MAAIGRGIYGVLVELDRRKDGLPEADYPLDALEKVLALHGSAAGKTDLNELKHWIGAIPPVLEEVLRATLEWLEAGDVRQMDKLLPRYAEAEMDRKGPRRARLSRSTDARERRREWNPETAPEPLHYRWPLVRVFLTDLQR